MFDRKWSHTEMRNLVNAKSLIKSIRWPLNENQRKDTAIH